MLEQALRVLRNKRDRATRLLSLSRELVEAAKGLDRDRLATLVAERDRILADLKSLDSSLEPLYHMLKDGGRPPDPAVGREVETLNREIEARLSEVVGLHDSILSPLVEEREAIERALTELRRGRQAIRGYHSGLARGPAFLDLKG